MKDEDCNITLLPTFPEMVTGLTTTQIVLLVLGLLTLLATLLLALAQINYCLQHISHRSTIRKMFLLIGLFPALSLTSLFGMLVPRAQGTVNQVAAIFIMVAMYTVTSLGRSIYKGRDKYSEELVSKEVEILMRTPPCCCCCCCLPKLKPTESNLAHLERLVLQSVFVRVVAIGISCFMNYSDRANHKYFDYLEAACVPSLLLAMYGSHVLIIVTLNYLDNYKIVPLFRIIDVTFGLYNGVYLLIFKQIIIRFFVTFPCGPVLSGDDNAKYISYFVLLIIFFLLSLLATSISKDKKNLLFSADYDTQRNRVNSLELCTSTDV